MAVSLTDTDPSVDTYRQHGNGQSPRIIEPWHTLQLDGHH